MKNHSPVRSLQYRPYTIQAASRGRHWHGRPLQVLMAAAWLVVLVPAGVSAASPLGSAQGFAVLGHETVTNAHAAPNPTTQVFGHLGVTPATSVTGFYPDGTVAGGAIHINDGVAQLAMRDATAAFTTLSNLPAFMDLTGKVLGSPGFDVLTPGVYHFDSSAQLSGALVLDFLGDPNSSFVFQIGSSLTTASSSSVTVINGNSNAGVFWQVGSSATLGTDTQFAGNILAVASVGLDPRAQILCGRAFALTGAVTLTDNLISNNCTAEHFGGARVDFDSQGYSGSLAAPVPEPGSWLLFGLGLAGLLAARHLKPHADGVSADDIGPRAHAQQLAVLVEELHPGRGHPAAQA